MNEDPEFLEVIFICQNYRLSWIIRIKRYFLMDFSQYQGRYLQSFSRSFILIKVYCQKLYIK